MYSHHLVDTEICIKLLSFSVTVLLPRHTHRVTEQDRSRPRLRDRLTSGHPARVIVSQPFSDDSQRDTA